MLFLVLPWLWGVQVNRIASLPTFYLLFSYHMSWPLSFSRPSIYLYVSIQVDMSDNDNAGLEIPIDAIAPVVSQFENDCISRADIWALAALVGAQRSQNEQDFPLVWVGRQNCASDNPSNGPFVAMPSSDMHIHDMLAYFAGEFNFDGQQVAALLGAHSLGRVHEENSGFVGNGWDNNNRELVRRHPSFGM